MDNPEKTERGNQKWTIQRKLKGAIKMGNQEWTIQRKLKGAIKNGQSREN